MLPQLDASYLKSHDKRENKGSNIFQSPTCFRHPGPADPGCQFFFRFCYMCPNGPTYIVLFLI